MAEYFYTEAIMGETPFKCYVCNEMLVANIKGEYFVELMCRRCKTEITLKTNKALPDTLVVKHGELVKL